MELLDALWKLQLACLVVAGGMFGKKKIRTCHLEWVIITQNFFLNFSWNPHIANLVPNAATLAKCDWQQPPFLPFKGQKKSTRKVCFSSLQN